VQNSTDLRAYSGGNTGNFRPFADDVRAKQSNLLSPLEALASAKINNCWIVKEHRAS